MNHQRAFVALFVLAIFAALPLLAQPVTPKAWEQVVDKGIEYLRKSQAPDGTWSNSRHVGITGLVLCGLLDSSRVDRQDPMIIKGLAAVERLINKQDGHIAGSNARPGTRNYTTCINMLALSKANDKGQYNDALKDSVKFLKGLQWDEGEGASEKDPRYGGFGYDAKSRPDLSNTQFALEALKAAGVPESDEAFKRAAVFVSRAQNLKSEHQDQPWAAKTNDGSFIYDPPATGGTKAIPGYGSMTYAGIKSLIYAGVDKNDPRVQTALKWARAHYSLDANVGQPPGKEQSGLFYYYHTMGKCLDSVGEEEFADDKGKKHPWRQDLFAALVKRQNADGSWSNPSDRFMEGDSNLVTGFALMALKYCQPK